MLELYGWLKSRYYYFSQSFLFFLTWLCFSINLFRRIYTYIYLFIDLFFRHHVKLLFVAIFCYVSFYTEKTADCFRDSEMKRKKKPKQNKQKHTESFQSLSFLRKNFPPNILIIKSDRSVKIVALVESNCDWSVLLHPWHLPILRVHGVVTTSGYY